MSSPTSIKTIEIHAFRWAEQINDKFDNGILERLRFGHVGIRVIDENPVTNENIYSFRPTKPDGMPLGEFMRGIKEGKSFIGQVLEVGDNVLFEIAKEYCGKTKIRTYSVDKNFCFEVKKQLDNDIAKPALENKRYSFPPKNREDRWQPLCFNCATYLRTLVEGMEMPAGVELPYPNGRLGDYLERGEYEITIYRCC